METILSYLNKQTIVEHNPDLREIVESIVQSCQQISEYLRTRTDQHTTPLNFNKNSHGELQKSADLVSNLLFLNHIKKAPNLAYAISEELDELCVFDQPKSDYIVAFDPLDGSSNVDINMTVGTIFGVWRNPHQTTETFQLNGRKLLIAGFATYGVQTTLTLTCGQGVAEFVLSQADWHQIRDNIMIPPDCQEFAINVSNYRHWQKELQHHYQAWLDGTTGRLRKDYNMRWTGSMVADVHRILNRGGVFLYPWDQRKPKQAGKLRLVYEGFPMAMIVEQAGGLAITESAPILDTLAHHQHQKTSVILGSKNEIEHLQKLLSGAVQDS